MPTFINGFRWRDDNGSETSATWLASQDTSIYRASYLNTRLRYLIDTDGDVDAAEYKLQYRKVGTATWKDLQQNWNLLSGHYESAKIPLEIIAPKSSLSTTNRYYKQYPGILYRVPVVVLGGAYPFKFELTAGPPGMTIGSFYGDADYGIINWNNPVTSGSPFTISVKVTDQEGTVATVSYTLTVTTTGFLFLDAVNGNDTWNGTTPAFVSGTTGPKKTFAGWYGGTTTAARDTDTFPRAQCILRAGSYDISGVYIDNAGAFTVMSQHKPSIYIGYPGENVSLNMAGSGHGAFYFNDSGNQWMSGMTVTGNSSICHVAFFDSGATNYGFFELNLQTPTAGGTNSSFFFSADNHPNLSQNGFISHCTFAGTNSWDIFLGYYTNKFVAQKNVIINNTGSGAHGFYAKISNQNWSIRDNYGLSGNVNEMVDLDMYSSSDNIEVCWNNYKSTNRGILVGPNTGGTMGTLSDYRNTWQVTYNEAQNVSSGTWNATKNVVVNNGTYTQGYGLSSSGVTINRTNLLAATTGLVDSNGLLTGADRTNYLGIRGHEVA